MSVFLHESPMPVPSEALSAWHLRPGAFERLTPPWQDVRLLSAADGVSEGSRAVLSLRQGPLRAKWVARHEEVRPGRSFVDVQESGPFASWRHLHEFRSGGPGASVLADRIEYRLPFSPVSDWFAGRSVARQLGRTFRYRHRITRRDLERHAGFVGTRLRVAISGGSGMIGSTLAAYLAGAGHEVLLLERESGGRGPEWAGRISWSVRGERVEREKLEGIDAVVHLAGSSIAERWTEEAKRRIRESRVASTRLLAETIATLARPPAAFLCASAVGWYDDTPDDHERVEGDPAGEGFLAEVARDWEAAAGAARAAGVRTVHLRFGVVLSPAGGALAEMLPAFRLGAGGPIGSGRQWFSWVSLEDVVGAIEHLLHHDVDGPVNVTAPGAVRQREFARVLGRTLRRPSFAPLPGGIVRILFGEMGERMLLRGALVKPARLLESGFRFAHPELEPALREGLGRFSE